MEVVISYMNKLDNNSEKHMSFSNYQMGFNTVLSLKACDCAES